MPEYRHTQVSWLLIGVLAAVSLALIAMGLGPALPAVVAVSAILVALFGWLTVRVDRETLAIRFGVGVIRRHIPLASIRAWSAVRNRWYWGWGIRFYPGGTLYNASGLDAVELTLAGGARVRVGTDEPARLVQALSERIGAVDESAVLAADLDSSQGRRVAVVALLAFIVAGAAIVAVLLQRGEPEVVLTGEALSIRGGWYRVTWALDAITGVSLEAALPRIQRRTNGFALGSTRHGHFRLETLGPGRLFVEIDVPPFVLVRAGDEYVFVNSRDPARTRDLYESLVMAGVPGAVPLDAAR